MPGQIQASEGIDISQVLFYIDRAADQDFLSVQEEHFTPYVSQNIPLEKNQSIWLKFDLHKHILQTDTFYLTSRFFEAQDCYLQLVLHNLNTGSSDIAGSWVPLNKLAIPENRFAIRAIALDTSTTFLLQLEALMSLSLGPIKLNVVNYHQAKAQPKTIKLDQYRRKIVIVGIFGAVLIICFFIALHQYYWYREIAYGYYCLYVLLVALYYLRSAEGFFGKYLATHGQWGEIIMNVESTIQYLTFSCYIYFIYHFLNLERTKKSRISLYIRLFAILFLCLAVFDVFIKISLGSDISRSIYDWIRIPFLILAIFSIFYILYRFPSSLNKFILVGTLLLCIPALFSVFVNVTQGWLGHVSRQGVLRVFTLYDSDTHIYMYHTRIGVMLEIVCFSLGLSYKNREVISTLREENQKAKDSESISIHQKLADPILHQIDQIIDNHLDDENFSIEDLCTALAISRSQLHKRIKDASGDSAAIYIRNFRLQEGCKLLFESALTISEIAYRVGFKDPNYFTRCFTKKFGMSPKRMREGHGRTVP